MIHFRSERRDELFSNKKKQGVARTASSNVSIASSSSASSAASFRSRGSSLSTASNALSLQRDATRKTNLPLPCHLNCQCEDCRKPNTALLDNLLNIGPVHSGTTTKSAINWATLGDDDVEF